MAMTLPTQISNGSRSLHVIVERSERLKTSVRWSVEGDDLRLRVPMRMPLRQIAQVLDDIKEKAFAQGNRTPQVSDAELEALARSLNQRYFDGALRWNSIRWVGTMQKRLGSCTVGGSTDGDIRISTRIQAWPEYVIEYVVAHEICHRKYADHSPDFWGYLARYPLTERARGFIDGIAYAENASADDLM